MTDDQSSQQNLPPAGNAPGGIDALSQLEELLAKAKSSKGQVGDRAAMPDPQAEAEKAAAEAQEKDAAFQAQMAESERVRQEALAAQQAEMAELAETPQYQARVQQEEQQAEEKQAEKVAHDGHEIVQISQTKI